MSRNLVITIAPLLVELRTLCNALLVGALIVVLPSSQIACSGQAGSDGRYGGISIATVGDLPFVAPELEFIDIVSGYRASLATYSGKVIVVNLWATWCIPCLIEMPELEVLHRRYRERGVDVIALSDESFDRIREFSRVGMYNYVIGVVDNLEALEPPFDTMMRARPVSVIVDREGSVTAVFVGRQELDVFVQAVESVL